ncbi:MAG: OmpH family outer membrane protein [Candidatus Aminicenantes bacterium]|nr:OmpH family outer membrane protein [Candidatus Aminicenantes bacterium]
MKKSSLKILMFLLLFAPAVSLSLAQESPKIGVINSQEVLEKSAEGKKVIARLQERDKANQAALTKLDDEIRQLETRLSTQRLTLSDEALFQMNSDLERKRTERKRLAEDSYRDWQELQLKLFNRVQNELIPIIEQLGKEKGVDLIFDLAKSGAVYFNPVIDLTDEVIKRYDASKAAAK